MPEKQRKTVFLKENLVYYAEENEKTSWSDL